MYDRKMLGLADAQKIMHAVFEHVAKRKDPPVSIAIVDCHGDFILFARLDGASWNTAQMARMKAYTAAKLRHDTSTMHQWMDGMGAELLDWGDPNVTTIGGGVCIRDDSGAVIGAVGVSGYPNPKDDEDAAKAGIAALLAV
jgi:glc operon protein GlcG